MWATKSKLKDGSGEIEGILKSGDIFSVQETRLRGKSEWFVENSTV